MWTFALVAALVGAVAAVPASTSSWASKTTAHISSSKATLSSTKPAATQAPQSTGSPTEPCALVSSSIDTFFSVYSDTGSPIIPGPLAYECLRSVPVDVDGDPDLVDGYAAYLQFQTTLEYLKNPPAGRLDPPVDLIAGLDSIASKLGSSYYHDEWTLQTDIIKLIDKSYDGHLTWVPDISRVFTFVSVSEILDGKPVLFDLASVSDDGTSLPKVYAACKFIPPLTLTFLEWRLEFV